MIESVRGRLLSVREEGLTVDVGGIELFVQVPLSAQHRLGPLLEGTGSAPTVRLHTHLLIRPDGWQLFGFLEPEERQLFRLLLGISGIGPRVSMNVLSHVPIREICAAVATGAVERFAAVPGVGKRIAARIVLELSGKLDDRAIQSPPGAAPAGQDAADALVAMGVGRPEAAALVRAASRELGNTADTPALITAALRIRRKSG